MFEWCGATWADLCISHLQFSVDIYLNMSTPSTEYVVIILWSSRPPLPQLLVPEQNSITLINNRRTGDPPLSQKKKKTHGTHNMALAA